MARHRVEPDYHNRLVFNILPLILANGLPSTKFELIGDREVRSEIEHHWRELQNALTHHAYRSLVSAAKNVAEGILYYGVRDHLQSRKRAAMGDMLPVLSEKLRNKTRLPLSFSDLDYHILSKLRLLHQRTHVEHGMNRPLRPEMALSAAQDLAELLRAVGLAE